MIKVNGTGSPVMGIIEEVTTQHVRLRSMSAFNEGDRLDFDLTLRGAAKTHMSGKVTMAAMSGTRKVYTISLKELAAEEARAVGTALDAAKSFQGRNHHDGEQTGGLTRSSVRVPCDMEVRFSADGKNHVARATNISTGGILLNYPENITIGTSIEVKFTLPGGTRELSAHARIIAHQQQTPNYNVAFHTVDEQTRSAIAAYVASREQK